MGKQGKPVPKFQIGDTVCHRSFVDCFGKHNDARTGLTVCELELIEPVSMAPWYRVKAIGKDGFGYVKAAETFFDAEAPC